MAWIAFLLAAGLVWITPATVWAQGSHYWSDQYGSRANLLGGMVIGSVRDASATYYNPGALSLSAEKSFVLATKVYQYASIKIPDGAGEGLDLNSSRVNAAPDLIAGEFSLSWLEGSKWAYSLLNRNGQQIEIKSRRSDPSSGPVPPPEDLSSAEAMLRLSVSEYWGGLTWSRRLSKRLGLGVTGYGAYRSQRLRTEVTLANSHADGSVDNASAINDLSFQDARLFAKFGLAYENGPLTLGVNLTTPSLHVAGKGESFIHQASSGVPQLDPPYDQPYLSADSQEDLDGRYKNPWSVGLGGSYAFSGWMVHLGAEWFDKIDPYRVLDLPTHYPQTGGEKQEILVSGEAASVVNWGVGLEAPIKERLTAYGSFAIDRSAAIAGDQGDLTVAEWDIYRGTLGVELEFGTSALTLGLGYGNGRKNIPLPASLRGDSARSSDDAIPEQTEVIYRRLKLLLGLDFTF